MSEDVQQVAMVDSEVSFVEVTLRVVAAVLVGLGIASMSLFVLTEPDVLTRVVPFLAVLLANVIVAWSCLAKRWLPQGVIAATLTATAVAAILLGTPVAGGQPFPLAVQLATLAATVAAVLLPFRQAIWVFVPIIVGTNIMIAARLLKAGAGDFVFDALVVAADTLGICIGVAAALQVWRRLARSRDTEAMEAALSTANAEIARERGEYLRQLTYGLHDTVINTLGVVRRGIPPGSSESVAARAADDLRQVDARLDGRDLNAQVIAFADLPRLASAQAKRLSLDLRIEVQAPFDQEVAAAIPARVLRGFSECLNEALLNVSKYARGQGCTVAIGIVDGTVIVTVSDGGIGRPSRVENVPTLMRRATASGIRMSLQGSLPGTTVEFRWTSSGCSMAADEVDGAGELALATSVARMARQLGGWIGGGYLLAAALAYSSDHAEGALIPILLGAVAVYSAVAASFWRVPIATELVVCIVAAMPVILYLETVGDDVCAAAGSTFPPSSWAALAAMMVILLSRPQWLGVAAVLAYALANGVIVLMAMSGLDCGSAYLSNYITDLAALVAIGLLHRRISRYFSDSVVDARNTANAEAEISALHSYSQTLQVRNKAMLGRSRAILGNIASHAADPRDVNVRAAAGEEEQHLRSLLRIEPELGLLGDELIAMVERGVARGVLVDITVISATWGQQDAPFAASLAQVGEVLNGLVGACEPGVLLRVTVDAQNPLWLAAVGDNVGFPAAQVIAVCGSSYLPIEVTSLEGQTIVEFLPVERS